MKVIIETHSSASVDVAPLEPSSFVSEFLEACATAGDRPVRLRVLDVGTGSARIPMALCARRREIEVLAVDRTVGVVRRAAENARRAGLETRIRFALADGQSLPFSDASCDAVISNGLVHHVANRVALLSEMLRVLHPGGVLFVRDSLRRADVDRIGQILRRSDPAGAPTAGRLQRFASAPLTMLEARALLNSAGLPAECLRRSGPLHWSLCGRL